MRHRKEVAWRMHKLFTTTCEFGERRPVNAADCERCGRGQILNDRASVLCDGSTRFFVAPCFWDMRSAATVMDCEACPAGEVSDDRLRVLCNKL